MQASLVNYTGASPHPRHPEYQQPRETKLCLARRRRQPHLKCLLPLVLPVHPFVPQPSLSLSPSPPHPRRVLLVVATRTGTPRPSHLPPAPLKEPFAHKPRTQHNLGKISTNRTALGLLDNHTFAAAVRAHRHTGLDSRSSAQRGPHNTHDGLPLQVQEEPGEGTGRGGIDGRLSTRWHKWQRGIAVVVAESTCARCESGEECCRAPAGAAEQSGEHAERERQQLGQFDGRDVESRPGLEEGGRRGRGN